MPRRAAPMFSEGLTDSSRRGSRNSPHPSFATQNPPSPLGKGDRLRWMRCPARRNEEATTGTKETPCIFAYSCIFFRQQHTSSVAFRDTFPRWGRLRLGGFCG